jgi:hypothetical protein
VFAHTGEKVQRYWSSCLLLEAARCVVRCNVTAMTIPLALPQKVQLQRIHVPPGQAGNCHEMAVDPGFEATAAQVHWPPLFLQDGSCPRRDSCCYAHNPFEYWLHPTR